MVVVSLHTQCHGGCGDFGQLWKVFGDFLEMEEMISTSFGPRKGEHPMLQKDGKLWTGCFSLVKQPLALLIISKIGREFKEAW